MPFTTLPREIKWMIWANAVPEDTSEVCILWPLYFPRSEKAHEPLLVDLPYPVLAHVCRESRQFITSPPGRYKRSIPRFRFSPQANCMVPFRPYIPELDTLHISRSNFAAVVRDGAISASVLGRVHHLSVDSVLWCMGQNWFPTLVFRHCQNLKTVSVAFPASDSEKYNNQQASFQVPSRRSRLVKVEAAEAPQGNFGLRSYQDISMREFVDRFWTRGIQMRAMYQWATIRAENGHTDDWYKGDAWDPEKRAFKNISRDPYVFVEFKRGKNGEELWEEVCHNRLLPPDYHAGEANRTRNPEEWRVNDEDLYEPHRRRSHCEIPSIVA
ncbi:hypothetical protein HJFPF1_12099 [Paramyrothecium foliicola]|nr:hypothetical protein HJFPF1_12099 [Paramyrothecium foliicola]